MIHVCFALTDKSGRYAKFTGTTLASIFANTSAQVTAHILHDATLTADNRDKLSQLAGRNQRVEFYNVDELCPDKITEIKNLLPDAQASHFSLATTYRLLLTQILPQSLDKIIYLDSDIIVNLDIAELWRVELGEKIFAAVPEIFSEVEGVDGMKKNFPLCRDGLVDAHDYFNAGVLLMNVARRLCGHFARPDLLLLPRPGLIELLFLDANCQVADEVQSLHAQCSFGRRSSAGKNLSLRRLKFRFWFGT